jgi:predicted DNA binding protein
MSVIVELEIPADAFELGRILLVDPDVRVELESMVPIGEKAVPLFWVYDHSLDTFEKTVRNHPSIERLTVVDSHEDRTLYALDWDIEGDLLFGGFQELDAHLTSASGGTTAWQFELRFPGHGALSDFREYCDDAHIPLEVLRVYNPTKPDLGPWFGVTESQREALVLAVEEGYYSLPRGISTAELASELGISDQAVTERLRRGIETLVSNALVTADTEEESQH